MSEASRGRIVLDTSTYSRFRSGNQPSMAILAESEQVLIPTIVLGELEACFRSGSRATENLASLTSFLAEPFVSVLPVTHEVARTYGQLFAELRKAGTPIGTNDLWIAAVTVTAGAHLVTFDNDFAAIRRLDCTIVTD